MCKFYVSKSNLLSLLECWILEDVSIFLFVGGGITILVYKGLLSSLCGLVTLSELSS